MVRLLRFAFALYVIMAFASLRIYAQEVIVEGQVMRSGDDQGVSEVHIVIYNYLDSVVGSAHTDESGFYHISLSDNQSYKLEARKNDCQLFFKEITTLGENDLILVENIELLDLQPEMGIAKEHRLVHDKKQTLPKKNEYESEARKEKEIMDVLGLSPKRSTGVSHWLEPSYTGFMVEVRTAKYSSATERALLHRFDMIWKEELGHDSCAYLVGANLHFDDVYLFFEEKVKKAYPNAKIIEFIEGERR